MPNHILEYQLSTPENEDVVQLTNFTNIKETSFLNPHLTPREKLKFRNLIAHLQGIHNHIQGIHIHIHRRYMAEILLLRPKIYPIITHILEYH